MSWLSTQVQNSSLFSRTWRRGRELWTWVESQLIWTSSELFELDTALHDIEFICCLHISETAISEVSIPASSQAVSQGIPRSSIMLKRTKRSPKGGGSKHDPPDDKDLGEQPAIVTAELDFLLKFMSLQTPNRIKIGHEFGGLIKSCTFRGRDCSNET